MSSEGREKKFKIELSLGGGGEDGGDGNKYLLKQRQKNEIASLNIGKKRKLCCSNLRNPTFHFLHYIFFYN